MNPHHVFFLPHVPLSRLVFILALQCFSMTVQAQVNNWTNPASGNWDNAVSWSAGLPNSSQLEVRITNANSKAVAIQPTTPVNFPSSMTVLNLRVGGVAPSKNLLLLNYSGTTTPLRVINDFNIETNGRALALSSGVAVNNALNVNGTYDQDGGALTFTNAKAQIEGGNFNITNTAVNGLDLHMGGYADAFANQVGGVVNITNMLLGYKANYTTNDYHNGTYSLRSGWLNLASLGMSGPGFGYFNQSSGTNSDARISVGFGTYSMTGGSLFLGDGMLTAGKGFGASYLGNISQTGGNITVTNTLRLSGSRILSYFYVATYNMSGGSLTALQIVLETAGTFTQSNGVIHLRQDLQIRDNGSVPSDYQMFGGSLFTSNTVLSTYPQTGHFYQNGGTHLVTNTLSIGGYAQYSLGSGTLSAPKIIISGSPTVYAQFFVSESAPPNAITNSDHMELAHAALVIPVSEQLGRVELYSASTLDFGHVAATIRFLDSHTNYWIQDTANPQRFSILNWSGSTNGGGTDRLTFGANSSALLPSQVAQIHFIDPAGFAPGTYPSQILSTGEVVPMMPPLVTAQVSGIKLVITWPGMFTLQAATNILGPFVDVTNAASPYTNSMNLPMQFFRVRD